MRDKGLRSPTLVMTASEQASYGDASFAFLIHHSECTRSDFVAYALERLMSSPERSDSLRRSYLDLHKEFIESAEATRLTIPDVFPTFSINELVAAAPSSIALRTLDSTLAAGWGKRRDAAYSPSNPEAKTQDVVPSEELFDRWRSKTRASTGHQWPRKSSSQDETAVASIADKSYSRLTQLSLQVRDLKLASLAVAT